ncbi:MAG: hypothetical protein QNK79_02160 [Synechococcus sp. ArSW.bin.68]|jgi:hypothetical protein
MAQLQRTSNAISGHSLCRPAAQQPSPQPITSNRWNADICASVLSTHGHRPIERSEQISQWVRLPEAIEEGSASISMSTDQMAEDLPMDLIEGVNLQLSHQGCRFQVQRLQKISSP